jgi:hypothetical protein
MESYDGQYLGKKYLPLIRKDHLVIWTQNYLLWHSKQMRFTL